MRARFPFFEGREGKPAPVYLDSAATSQKPANVIDTVANFYRYENANIHRGLYGLSEEATRRFEETREKIRAFIGAKESSEIVFTRGATEAINLVAASYGGAEIRRGDLILVSEMEHHANIVPWMMLAERVGAKIEKIPMTDRGELERAAYAELLNRRPKLVAVTHQSNALGTVNPVRELVAEAHRAGAVTVIDGAQAIVHSTVDVAALDADFYVFSGHKMYGPTGVGVLYARAALLEKMPPYHGGGEMIQTVEFASGFTAKPIPHRFEAGTPPIAEVIGLGAAVDFLNGIDRVAAAEHEARLLGYGTKLLEAIPGVRIIGTAKEKSAVISFVVDGVHPHDLGTVLDSERVCIRAGQHCAQPVMDRLGIPATARASIGLYSLNEDFDALISAIEKASKLFA